MRGQPFDGGMETGPMVERHQMGDFMSDDIIKHLNGCHDQPPGKAQFAFR